MTADLRETVARAMAEAAGSKAFREPGREWDHLRSVWLGHADAALAAVEPRMADLHADRTDAMNDQDRLRAAIRHAAARIGIAAIKAPDDLKPRLLAISGGLREAVEPEATDA